MPARDRSFDLPDPAWNDIVAAGCGTPTWSTGTDGAVLDLRVRQGKPIPPFADMSEATYADGRAKTLPDGTIAGVRMFNHDGVALHVRQGDRAMLVVRDTGGTIGSATYAAMVDLMPGIQAALPKVYAGTLDRLDSDDDAFWERRDRTATVGIDVLLDAVAGPHRWAGKGPDFDPNTAAGAVGLLGWASVGMRSASAVSRVLAAGIAPDPYVVWGWFGWSDEGILAWLPNSAWEPEQAMAYRDAGMQRDQAGVWLRNAKGLHPATAAVLAGRGWSATAATRFQKVLEQAERRLPFASWWPGDDRSYPEVGDTWIQGWAQVDGFTTAEIALCVRAGLSPAEASALRADGTWDLDVVRLQAALRS